MLKMFCYLVILCAVIMFTGTQEEPYRKLDPVQYHNMTDGTSIRRVSLWLGPEANLTCYRPDEENQYHLYTRQNPSTSDVLISGDACSVRASHFSRRRPTALLIHGWMNDASSDFPAAVVPAFLAANDMNVIVVDWSAGAKALYAVAVLNTVTSGESVARFIKWLNSVTGADVASYHIVGHSLGGQQAGIVGRNLGGKVAYITALDPAQPGWILNENKFRASDGRYTEIIHTNAGILGFEMPLGHVDFYPNGGTNMPGCDDIACDHERSYYYFAESVASGGFVGTGCSSYREAMDGQCDLPDKMNMGGIYSKTGRCGIFYLETNVEPPYSKNKEEFKLDNVVSNKKATKLGICYRQSV